MPCKGDRNPKRQARMDKGALHAMSALPAPVPEIFHSVRRRQNQAARTVSSSVKTT